MTASPCTVRLYSRDGCCLCDEVQAALADLRTRLPFEIETVDIDTAAHLRARHGERIPVVEVNGREIGAGRVPATLLEQHIALALGTR